MKGKLKKHYKTYKEKLRSKFTKKLNPHKWFSPSSLGNYVRKDPLLDFLNFKSKALRSSLVVDQNVNAQHKEKSLDLEIPNYSFMNYIRNQGLSFEQKVIDLLRLKGLKITTVAKSHTDAYKIKKFWKTFKLLCQGTPIIYQGVLHDDTTNTFGIPDLIVRSDFLPLISQSVFVSDTPSKSIFGPWHYVIIDIKYTTLRLKSNGVTLLNSGNVPAYKTQVIMYNNMISRIQNFEPKYAYILGRGWNFTSCNVKYTSNNCLDKLGHVDVFDTDSEYQDTITKAINWLKNLRENGKKWTISPPSVPELYPNMNNIYDSPWRTLKEEIADEVHEITSIWQCGVKNRLISHEHDIYGWDDPDCCSNTLGINGEKYSNIINKMLDFNRKNDPNVFITPQTIDISTNSWLNTEPLEFFIDFETLNVIFENIDTLPSTNNNETIFMIGVAWVELGQWNYDSIYINNNSYQDESQLLQKFFTLINQVCQKNGWNHPPNVYHWGHADPTFLNKALRRHPEIIGFPLNWINFHTIVKNEPILIKGGMNFSLKTYGRLMAKYGLINEIWESNGIMDGPNAMVAAYQYYTQNKNPAILNNLITYNHYDCKVLYQVIKCFRNFYLPDV